MTSVYMLNLLILGVVTLVFMNLLSSPQESFFHKLPYDNLETGYYKKHYYNKHTPKGIPWSPGFFKQSPDYFEKPNLLKHNYLGYSITGYPYQDYKFSQAKSSNKVDLKHLDKPFLYPKWYHTHRKEADYIGYPWYFGGKHYY